MRDIVPTIADTVYIATTAAEGGIGYWSIITSKYEPSRYFTGPDDTPATDLPEDYVFYTISEDAETADGGLPQTWDVTPAFIRKGFALAMRPDANVAGWAFRDQIGDDPDDVAAIDADAADVVIQMAAYGDIIWG